MYGTTWPQNVESTLMKYPDPLPTEEREHHLARLRDRATSDADRKTSRDLVIVTNLRLVEKALRRWRHRRDVDLDDLRQAGILALIASVEKPPTISRSTRKYVSGTR